MTDLEKAASTISEAINGPNWYIISAGAFTAAATVVLTWISGYRIAKWSHESQRIGSEASIALAIHEEIKSIREIINGLEEFPSPYCDVDVSCLRDTRILSVYIGSAESIGKLHQITIPPIVNFYSSIIQLKNAKKPQPDNVNNCYLDRSELRSLKTGADLAIVALQARYKLKPFDVLPERPSPWYKRKLGGGL